MVSLPVCLCEVPLTITVIASSAAVRPQSQLPFSLTSFAQGSSRPMNNHSSPQLHDQVHPPGVPASAAADSYNYSRALNGASHSMYDFAQLLGERNIQLAPADTADTGFRPVDPQQGFVFSAEPSPEPLTPPAPTASHLPVRDDESLPPSSPPRSSPAPIPRSPVPPPQPSAVPRPVFTLPPPATRVQGHATTAGLAGLPLPHLPALAPRPPVFSLPSPPRAQQEAGPSQEPTQAEPSQPLPLFRFGPVRSKTPPHAGSPTDSEGSTDTAPPSPEPEPASHRILQRERAFARLDLGLPSSPDVPRLRPATFSPPPQCQPLRRERAFRISLPASPTRTPDPTQAQPTKQPAAAEAAPSRQPIQEQAGPSEPPAQVEAAPSKRPAPIPTRVQPARAGTKRKAGPLMDPARAPAAAPASQPAAEPQHSVAAPMRMRDPADRRFFMPMLPEKAGTNATSEPSECLIHSRRPM